MNGNLNRNLKIPKVKEAFVDVLSKSGLEYTIIRPNGFFSDTKDFLDMAKKGKVYLFENGEQKFNPIHGTDLAIARVDAIFSYPFAIFGKYWLHAIANELIPQKAIL